MNYKFIQIVLLIAIYTQNVFSIDFNFELISTQEGLSSLDMVSVFQDSKGQIYFGSFEGIHLFNGYSVTNYKPDITRPYTLNVSGVHAFAEVDNKIWMTSGKGIDVYDPETGIFSLIYKVQYQGSNYQLFVNQSISVDASKNIYIPSFGGGIFKFNKGGKVIGLYPSSQNTTHGEISYVFIDEQNTVWAGAKNGHVLKLDTSLHIIKAYDLGRNNTINKIFKDTYGNLWVGTHNGVFRFKPNTDLFEDYSHLFKQYGVNGLEIRGICQLKEGTLLFGSDGSGILEYDPIKNLSHYYPSDNRLDGSLTSNNIRDLFVDNIGNIWVALYGYGVNFHGIYKNKINSYKISNAGVGCEENRIKGHVKDMSKGKGHIIYFATSKGIVKFDYKKQTFQNINISNKSVSIGNTAMYNIFYYKNRFFLSAYNKGLVICDENWKILTHYPGTLVNKANDVLHSSITCIEPDEKGNVWLGYLNGGLTRYNIGSKSFIHYSDSILSGESIDAKFTKDLLIKRDTIWIGASGRGLLKLDLKTMHLSTYNLPEKRNESLNTYSLFQFIERSDGSVWLATSYGLRMLNDKKNAIVNYSDNPFLLETEVKSIVEHEGFLWMACQNIGIVRLNIKSGEYEVFNESDGLTSLLFNDNSSLLLENGEILFGGKLGLNLVNKDNLGNNPIVPNIQLNGLKILNKSVDLVPLIKKSDIMVPVASCKDLFFSYKDKSIMFEFVALEYNNPDNVRYKYKLEGFNDSWIETDANKRYATYTRLPGGRYTFRVIASNGDGLWNDEGISINVHVKPPFWKTYWFIGLWIIILFFLVYTLHKWRMSIIKGQNRKLEETVKEKTKELKNSNQILMDQGKQLSETNTLLVEHQQRIEEQTEELMIQKDQISKSADGLRMINSQKDKLFSIIAHDLKSPFNTLMGFAELLKLRGNTLNEKKKETYIDAVYKSSKSIYTLLDNLLLWARKQTGGLNFAPVELNINNLIDETMNVLKDIATEKRIHMEKNVSENMIIHADKNMLQTVFRNLISNALKFTPEGGNIKIVCEFNERVFICKISDSGIGIPKEIVDKLFNIEKVVSRVGTKGEKGTGLGLVICKDFIDAHRGKLWVESEVGKGSVFAFSIPNF